MTKQRITKKAKLRHILVWAALIFGVSAVSAREEGTKAEVKTGIASWYGTSFHGKRTANGDTFNRQALTCASNQYPLGTWLRVTNLRNGKSVVVKVNDRMHPRMRRVVDLSQQAARQIGIEKTGVGKVEVRNLGKKMPQE
jgi:rare lipoprotein A